MRVLWGGAVLLRFGAVLLCSAGVVLATGSVLHLLLLFSLAVVRRGKARFEEQGLRAVHP